MLSGWFTTTVWPSPTCRLPVLSPSNLNDLSSNVPLKREMFARYKIETFQLHHVFSTFLKKGLYSFLFCSESFLREKTLNKTKKYISICCFVICDCGISCKYSLVFSSNSFL